MSVNTGKINLFLMLRLPSAFLCGVRLKQISDISCTTNVRHRWINQNPFGSLYFAVQAMAAELSTGALVLLAIRKNQGRFSMLVTGHTAVFSKKAKGIIAFSCNDGLRVSEAVAQAAASGEAQVLRLTSVGKDQQGDLVSTMVFEWSIRKKLPLNAP
ncbi:MAG TPA: DUF4442 domain-containing protein [Flavobacterium sp.]